MKKIVARLSAVAVVGVTYKSIAQDITPKEYAVAAVDQRKSLFKTIHFNLGPIFGMAQGVPSDAEVGHLVPTHNHPAGKPHGCFWVGISPRDRFLRH